MLFKTRPDLKQNSTFDLGGFYYTDTVGVNTFTYFSRNFLQSREKLSKRYFDENLLFLSIRQICRSGMDDYLNFMKGKLLVKIQK